MTVLGSVWSVGIFLVKDQHGVQDRYWKKTKQRPTKNWINNGKILASYRASALVKAPAVSLAIRNTGELNGASSFYLVYGC